MTVVGCPECAGRGWVEIGAVAGCKCPYHMFGNAECGCGCGHYSDECGFCGGAGTLTHYGEAAA